MDVFFHDRIEAAVDDPAHLGIFTVGEHLGCQTDKDHPVAEKACAARLVCGRSTVGFAVVRAVVQPQALFGANLAATNGLDDNDGGVNALYIENAAGVLKAMYPTAKGVGGNSPVQYITYPVSIVQNDTATVTASL